MDGDGTDYPELPSWIAGFCDYTKELPSPEIMRVWTAIAAIAGVIERRVWVKSHKPLFPNMYIILTGPPGVGKTVMTSTVQEMWSQLPEFQPAPSSVSRASLVDCLEANKRAFVGDGKPVEYHALSVISNELGSFIPAWDGEFMSVVTDLYDGQQYLERKRGNNLKVQIDKPCLNILAGTTPSWLLNTMPVGAWEQGFTSRSFFVYSGEKQITDLFGGAFLDPVKYQALLKGLSEIKQCYGEMSWTPEAAQAISAWHKKGGPPIPQHPKLAHYLTRRSTHLLKICTVVAVAGHPKSLVITLEDYQMALNILVRFEAALPDIFRAMIAGGDSAVMEDLHYFIYTIFMKEKAPVSEHRLVAFLRERTPSHNVMRIIEVMTKSQMMKAEIISGLPHYQPLAKHKIT